MPIDKAIKYGKEKRKLYRDSRRFDYTCRNHGSCGWCYCNRIYKFSKSEPVIDREERFLLNKHQWNSIKPEDQ